MSSKTIHIGIAVLMATVLIQVVAQIYNSKLVESYPFILDCDGPCPAESVCFTRYNRFISKCTVYIEEGLECEEEYPYLCAPGLICINGTKESNHTCEKPSPKQVRWNIG